MKKIIACFIVPALIIVSVYTILIRGDKNQQKNHSVITLNKFQKIQTALKAYKKDCGSFPQSSQGLNALIAAPNSKPLCEKYPASPYLKNKEDLLDSWNKKIHYVYGPQKKYYLISLGEDEKLGGKENNTDIKQAVFGSGEVK